MKEVMKSMIAIVVATAEIGRVKKIKKLPFERRSDWRRFNSNIGPSMKASNNGAAS